MSSLQVEKNLLTEEDIAYGEGLLVQQRQGIPFNLSKVRGFYPVNSIDELNALDPVKHPKAVLCYSTSATFYSYISGAWVKLDPNSIFADLANNTDPAKGAALVGYNGQTVADALDDLANNADPTKGAALVGYKGRTVADKLGDVVSVKDFGAVGDGVADDTTAIQAAIDYACGLVTVDNFTPGNSDRIGGVDVVFTGIYKITDTLRVNKSNVRLIGKSGATIHPHFSPSVFYKPAIVVGTAEAWQTAGDITNTTKYNAVNGFLIKWPEGGGGFIGILSSGTRNMEVSNVLVERGFCGLYMENTSELFSKELAVTGCTYSIIGDNRGGRSAANSPLGVACTDNDVSSNNITMITSYYSQHTGILLINTGTTKVNGTVGVFSDNPSEPEDIRLGLPTRYAAAHVVGVGQKWTRGGALDGIVFEAKQDTARTCVLLESQTNNCPISGFAVDNCHVQTYASNHDTGAVTTLIEAITSGGGSIHATITNSGFTPQSSGYMYGNMVIAHGDVNLTFSDCYPPYALASSSASRLTRIGGVNTISTVRHDVFPPTGWTAENTGAGTGAIIGVGQQSVSRFTGNTTLDNVIYREFSYREDLLSTGCVYCTFLVKGNASNVVATCIVNGQNDTKSSIVNPVNNGRYSNQNYRQPTLEHNESEWTRAFMVFRPFDAGYSFDKVLFAIGRGAGSASEYIDITGIEVGYINSFNMRYNPF